MANVFINIPVPLSNTAGAAVDVSSMGRTKSLVIGGGFHATVDVEYATDLAGTDWAPLATFHQSGNLTVDVAAHWMRAVTSVYVNGVPNLDVGSSDAGSSFVLLTANGAAVSVSALPLLKTVVTPVGFVGTVDVSEDGSSWAQIFAFQNGGGVTREVVAQFARVTGGVDGVAVDVYIGGAGAVSSAAVIPDPLTIDNLKFPTTFETALAAGVTDPWIPGAGWLPGETTICLHQRVSTFNSFVKCLPRPAVGIEPDVVIIVINAGDGGGTFTQTGILTMEHMAAAYDNGQGGSNAVYLPFYFAHQRNAELLPGDAAFFRQDEGHESWRCIAQTQGGKLAWAIPSMLSLAGRFTFVAAAGNQQPFAAATPGAVEWQQNTRVYVDTTAGAATFLGIAPPTPATWDPVAAAYKAYGGDYRRIWNLGPNNLTLNLFDAGANAGWQFLQATSGTIVLAPFQSIGIWYEPFGSGFWTIDQ